MHSESCVAVSVVKQMGISSEAVCTEIERCVEFGPLGKVAKVVPYTPSLKRALALAGKDALSLSHPYVGTQHMLLGLLRTQEGVAGKVLKGLKMETKVTRQKIVERRLHRRKRSRHDE
jgi:ATP-dependent Clp protease ATP-binding subunit ClpC